jgi:hypothetical protein
MHTGTEEKLIGFDARVMWLTIDDRWDAERKSDFLVREDVSYVLSTDTRVWSSVFDDIAYGAGKHEIPINGPELPNSIISSVYPLWLDLEQLLTFIRENGFCIKKPVWIIGISQLIEAAKDSKIRDIENPKPLEIDKRWQLLGYDVADGIRISGLSNCSYQDQEKLMMKESGLEQRLNSNHLFDSIDHAKEFKIFSDKRVPEHFPFRVYGLYLIRKLED